MQRFLHNSGGNLESGALAIVSAWDRLHTAWRKNDAEIFAAVGYVNKEINKKIYGPGHFSVKAEEALAERVPEAFIAVNGLRKAITFLDGRDIQWWHHQGPKPVRRMEAAMIEGIVEGNTLVEDGHSYGRFEGTVLGSEVGFNNVFQSIGVWVGVAHSEPVTFKIQHPFEAMYGIELVPLHS